MTPSRPYLTRAIYEWICDNELTPYLLADATLPNVMVPTQHIQDGQIVLNVVPHAVHQLNISNDAIQFSARFGGVSQQIYIPLPALLGIYARENGQGLFFDPNEYPAADKEEMATNTQPASDSETTAEKKKPSFRVLD